MKCVKAISICQRTPMKMLSFQKGMSLTSKDHMIKEKVVSYISIHNDRMWISANVNKMNNSKCLETSLQLVHRKKNFATELCLEQS